MIKLTLTVFLFQIPACFSNTVENLIAQTPLESILLNVTEEEDLVPPR